MADTSIATSSVATSPVATSAPLSTTTEPETDLAAPIDEAMLRAERIAFLSLASELARERDVLVVDDGASALAGVAKHLNSTPAAELATVDEGAYDLVVADLFSTEDAARVSAESFARALNSTGIALLRVPNTADFAALTDAVGQHFAHSRMLRQHNWAASAVFDDAAFAWDDPSTAAAASLRKLAAAQPGEELYSLLMCSNAELPKTVPHLAITRSAVLRELMAELQSTRDRAAAQMNELAAVNAAQSERIRQLDDALGWFDQWELNQRASIESKPWAMALVRLWARAVWFRRRALKALRRSR